MDKQKSILYDIQYACELILQYTDEFELETFRADVLRQDAVQRRLAIIGEASNKLDDDFKKQHPEVPWSVMRGMRNRLVHTYNEIDIDLVWTTITNDIPVLIDHIKRLISD